MDNPNPTNQIAPADHNQPFKFTTTSGNEVTLTISILPFWANTPTQEDTREMLTQVHLEAHLRVISPPLREAGWYPK